MPQVVEIPSLSVHLYRSVKIISYFFTISITKSAHRAVQISDSTILKSEALFSLTHLLELYTCFAPLVIGSST